MLALLAAFTGSPYTSQHARIDVDALAKAVQHEDDHVTAIELAGWIKNRRPGLRVVDVRSKEAFEEYHVPMAERVPLDSLSAIHFAPSETIVHDIIEIERPDGKRFMVPMREEAVPEWDGERIVIDAAYAA